MELQTFNNKQFGELRTAEIEGKIYYCGTDVAKALGYSKPQDAVSRHCRYSVKRGVPHPQNPVKEIDMSFIPEGDVYRLTARSKLPQAEKFESWVFDEVLPQIAHTGGYKVPQNPMDALQLMFDAQKDTNSKVEHLKEDVETRFDDLPLIGDEPDDIRELVNEVALCILGSTKRLRSPAYKDASIRSQVYSDIWHELKRKFNVRKYKAIKRKYIEEAIDYLTNEYRCPEKLLEVIREKNEGFV